VSREQIPGARNLPVDLTLTGTGTDGGRAEYSSLVDAPDSTPVSATPNARGS
jgi:hypothetical protein